MQGFRIWGRLRWIWEPSIQASEKLFPMPWKGVSADWTRKGDLGTAPAHGPGFGPWGTSGKTSIPKAIPIRLLEIKQKSALIGYKFVFRYFLRKIIAAPSILKLSGLHHISPRCICQGFLFFASHCWRSNHFSASFIQPVCPVRPPGSIFLFNSCLPGFRLLRLIGITCPETTLRWVHRRIHNRSNMTRGG